MSGEFGAVKSYLMDMDGVIVHEEQLVPGADRFIARLRKTGHPFLILTNNSMYTARDLAARLALSGLDVEAGSIWTSALATAQFLTLQRPGGSAFVIGEAGLTTALHEVGYTLSERNPDYVVLGETRTYSFEQITRAIRLLDAGARFIATNPDPVGPSRHGSLPATGSVAALISKATGIKPYFVGKPNPLMMRSALRAIGAHSETTVMIGDRMDTDIVAGIEAGVQTVLVLSGIPRSDGGKLSFSSHPHRRVSGRPCRGHQRPLNSCIPWAYGPGCLHNAYRPGRRRDLSPRRRARLAGGLNVSRVYRSIQRAILLS